MDFSFFTTNNKSGYKTNEKWLSNNEPELYSKIIEYSKNIQNEISFKEKIYFYFHKLKERPKCVSCSNEIKFRNRFDKPYGDFCSLSCANNSKEELVNRQKRTFNKKYGVDFYPHHIDFVKKQKQTKLDKYGDENYNNVEKSKITKELLYGNKKYNNIEKQKETCELRYGVNNYAKSEHYHDKLNEEYIKLYPDVTFVQIKKGLVVTKCEKCGNSSEITKQLLYERHKRNHNHCLTCNPIGFKQRSSYEDEICDLLDSTNISYIQNYKLPNTKFEIDIFLPTQNIGIEFNGLYWHNELFKDKEYHLNKTKLCDNFNIKLIHIFEDEWLYKRDIVKSILKNKLNIGEDKIYARKCIIKEVSTQETKNFLENNHIQGNVNSKVKLGLYYNNEMVSLMTFSKGRIIMGGKSNEWELNRFCNKINTTVIGSASKLLKKFINDYQPIKIVSYSDIRLFDGKMYETLKFKEISTSKPNYWYVIGDLRHYRFSFNKKKLIKDGYDPNKTEQEIMLDRKIYRIYDCGNVRWELTSDIV
jgi:hypothetical protein